MEAAQAKMELHCHDEAIEKIRGTFSRQLTRLAKKEAAIDESRKDWTTEEESYKKSRSEHEAEVTAHSDALVAHDKLITQIQEEVSIAEKLTKVIAIEIVMSESVNDDAVDDNVMIAQAEVLRCEAAAEEANQVLMAAKAAIDKLVEEISIIEVRLPILEAEKNQAASKRDFKAAGKASKEIKELNARKERCEEELSGDAVERQTAAQGEVDNCIQILEDKKSILYQKEKEGGRQRMIQLVRKIFKLEKIREDICGIGEEELESESVKSVGGLLLDSEIVALVSEGEALGNKFGGWDELMIEYAEKGDYESNLTDTPNVEEKQASNPIDDEEVHEDIIPDEDENDDCVVNTNNDVKKEADEETSEENKIIAQERCKSILSEINKFEAEIEVAIDEEDYDTAAVLDEKILTLREEMNALGLSESEIECMRIIDGEKESSNDSKGSQFTDKSYDMVSNKSEGQIIDEEELVKDEKDEIEEQKDEEVDEESFDDNVVTAEQLELQGQKIDEEVLVDEESNINNGLTDKVELEGQNDDEEVDI